MENIVKFPVAKRPVDEVLKEALDANMTDVIILGYASHGSEYFDTTLVSGAPALWLLERAKHELMHFDDEGE